MRLPACISSTNPFQLIKKGPRLVVLSGLTALVLVVHQLHGFLAITHRVDASVLIVEAWIWNSPAIKNAADEFTRGHYSRLVTVGSVSGSDGKGRGDEKSVAQLAASRLEVFGLSRESIVVLAVPDVPFHRTYSSALAVRKWIQQSGLQVGGVNVVTSGAHARKSLVLFQRALGPAIEVGVIAGIDETYDPEFWWLSPTGVYIVARKAVGYFYAVLWPFPSEFGSPPV